jgi:transcriptional antiterminator NusG
MKRFNWYAVHTLSQSEYKVKTLIEKTKVKANMNEEILDIIIPTDTEVQKKEGKKIEKKVKVFPGYILIRMHMSEESFSFIKRTPGITSFVSSNGKPVIIKDTEVENILEALDPNKNILPKKKWSKNMVVRIAHGPFSDFTGKIEDVNEQKETLTIMISVFGRDTPVEIDFGKVEKLS